MAKRWCTPSRDQLLSDTSSALGGHNQHHSTSAARACRSFVCQGRVGRYIPAFPLQAPRTQ